MILSPAMSRSADPFDYRNLSRHGPRSGTHALFAQPVYRRDVEPAACESPSTMAPPNRSRVITLKVSGRSSG
jgi:hypothetical protein